MKNFKTLETTDLSNVTGGCAACGGNCAQGPAAQQQSAWAGKTAGAWAGQWGQAAARR